MVPPLQWEPCEFEVPGDCRQLVREWDPDRDRSISGYSWMEAKAAGEHHLMVVKGSGNGWGIKPSDVEDYAEWVITPPDGPVKFALRMPAAEFNKCRLFGESTQEGYYAFTMERPETPVDALLFGHVSDPQPKVPFYDDLNEGTPGWGVGSGWIIRALGLGGSLTMHSHDFTIMKEIESPFPIGGIPYVFGKDLLWGTGDTSRGPIGAYDEERGFHILVDVPNTAYANGVGSDGTDIVWTLGEGDEEWADTWPVRSVITAPYTTDPAAIKPRRLRSDAGLIVGPDPWGVGCGYAGRPIIGIWGLQIVRLSDGVAWHLPRPTGMSWDRVIGITCDELFARVNTNSGSNIARVRLDSLGPGLPPD